MSTRYDTAVAIDSPPSTVNQRQINDLRRSYTERRLGSGEKSNDQILEESHIIAEFIEWMFDPETYN